MNSNIRGYFDQKITISMGVAALEAAHNENLDKLISRADSAMYQAKLKRNHVCRSTH